MSRLLLILLLITSQLAAQGFLVLPRGADPSGVSSVQNSYPLGQTSATFLHRIPAAQLDPSSRRIRDIAYAPAGTGTWSSPRVVMAIGHIDPAAVCPYSLPDLASGSQGVFRDLTYLKVNETLTLQATAGQWLDLGLGSSFRWDGVNDVGVFFAYENATTSGSWNGSVWRPISPAPVTSFSVANAFASTTPNFCGASNGMMIRLRSGEPEYQRNTPRLSLDHDGVQTDGSFPAAVFKCVGESTVWNQSGTPNQLIDAIVAVAPLVPASDPRATILNDGQVCNVDRTSPTAFQLYPGFTPFVPFSITFSASSLPITYSAQYFTIDVTMPSFLRLSQAIEVNVSDTTPAEPGPTGDDSSVLVPLETLCAGPFAFYGTQYSNAYVQSNGRITFGADDTDFTASIRDAIDGPAFLGYWTDLAPNLAGTITYRTNATDGLIVEYAGVRYFSASSPNDFRLVIDGSGDGRVEFTRLGLNLAPTSTSEAAFF